MAILLEPPIGPLPSEEDFLFTLQLSEGPPIPLTSGIGQWKQMYRMASDADDPRGMISAIQNIYNGFNSTGRAGEALMSARRLLSLGHEVGDAIVVGHALNNIAWAYWVMGDHVSALHVARDAFDHAVTLLEKPLIHPLTGPEEIRASASELLRIIGQSRGRLRRSIADREAALRVSQERRDLPRIISALEGLGLVYKDLGDYAAAARYFTEALREAENASFPNAQTRLLTRAGLVGNLGVVLTHAGDTLNALARIEEAIGIHRALSDQFGLIGTFGQKGRALLRAGRVAESINSLQSMLKLAAVFNAESWCYAAHFNLARAYLAAGDRPQAAFHCEHACSLAQEKLGHVGVEDHWLRAVLFHPLAALETTGGDLNRFIALGYFAIEALREAVRGSMPSVVIGRWIDAFERLVEAAFCDASSKPLCSAPNDAKVSGSPEGHLAFKAIEKTAQASPFIGWLPLDIGLYCTESLRAQEFQERMLLNTAELQELHGPGVVEELARVEAELEQLQRSPPIVVTGKASFTEDGRLVEGERESDESIARQERAQEAHLQRRRELTAIRDRLARRTIESFDTPIAPLPEPARLAEVLAVLGEDELLLEFVLLGQTDSVPRPVNEILQWPAGGRPQAAYVIAITRSWMGVVPLGPTAEIESRCEKLLDILDRFGASLSPTFFQSEAADVYDLLLRPVWKRAGNALHSVRHIVVAPDGLLHKVPIDLLVENREDASCWSEMAFLVRRYTTEYTPSATLFVDSRRGRYCRGAPGRSFVGLGDPTYARSWQPSPLDPLPGTRKELDGITSAFRLACPPAEDISISLLLAAEASKARLLDGELLKQAAYLHLSCHGSAGMPPFPDGALYLAQATDATVYECVLTMREVMDLRTHAKLVVLSACESGLGTLSRGEGIHGLTRAWLFAGAQAVAATYWRVDDEATADLMASFYRELLANNTSVADALATAKRAALESVDFSCPAFWGAFVLTGGRSWGSPLPQHPPNTQPVLGSLQPHARSPRLASLNHREHGLLSACARAWEWTWGNAQSIGTVFCIAATDLGQALKEKGQVCLSTSTPLGLVARNCRVGWDYWARQRQMALAIKAYQAYATWVPSARTEEADAVVSAYKPDNHKTVRQLIRERQLTRNFELVVDASLNVTLRTRIAWVGDNTATSASLSPVEVTLPVDASVTCESGQIKHCRDSGWVAFRIAAGETVQLAERLSDYVVTLQEDTFVMGGTWGSSLVPHDLTIRLHPDLIPLRLQRESMGKGASVAAVRFTPQGAVVTLRTEVRPWLERVALMFRRVPGAIDMFAGPNSPFLGETEFGEFEQLFQQAMQLSQG